MKHTNKGSAFTQIILEIFKVSGLLGTEGDRLTAPLGISSAKWKILGALYLSEKQLTVSQIARNMGQSRQSVQTLVNVLNQSKLVQFVDNPNHKRAKLIALTFKGKETYEEIDAIQIPWANKLADEISSEDLNNTLKILKAISKKLL